MSCCFDVVACRCQKLRLNLGSLMSFGSGKIFMEFMSCYICTDIQANSITLSFGFVNLY